MKNMLSSLNIVMAGMVCFLASYYFSAKGYQDNFSQSVFTGEYNRFAKLSEGVNRMVHLPLSDSRGNSTSLACPDALYSVMSYDLSERPLGLFIPLPVTSWAFTVYDENCNAYYSLDERTFAAGSLQAVLYKDKQETPKNKDAVTIKSPGIKGIVVMRLILEEARQKPELTALRREIKTGSIKTN